MKGVTPSPVPHWSAAIRNEGGSSSLRRFGVVGWPLDYSLSPAIHNAAITHFSLPAAYQAFRVAPEEWDDYSKSVLSPGGLEGFNVTIPYKEKVLGLAKTLTGPVVVCRAANTMVRGPDGWTAHTTDGQGLLEDLLDNRMEWAGKSVVLLGAGGAARAALFSLGGSVRPPRALSVINRSRQRAQNLADDFREVGGAVEVIVNPDLGKTLQRADLLINATSVGLKEGDPSCVPPSALHRDLAVYDMVYHRETSLVSQARSTGAIAVGGLGMLVNQGALAFELWFKEDLKKVKYDPRVLRKIMGDAARVALKGRDSL